MCAFASLAFGNEAPDDAGHLFADRLGRIQVGEAAPPLELSGLLQAPVDARADWAALRGNVVVLDFWATWCAPCIASMPHLNELVETFAGERVRFISITEEEASLVENFLAQTELRSWIGLDANGATAATYGIPEVMPMPALVVVDAHGKVAAITVPSALTEKILRDLLAESSLPRPSLFEVSIRPSSARSHSSSNALGRFTARRVSVKWLVSVAYGVEHSEVVDDAGLDDRFYDVVVAAPQGRQRMKPLLRAALETTFGIRTRRERREVDAFELIPADSGFGPNFRSTTAAAGEGFSNSMGENEASASNSRIDGLAAILEILVQTPIVHDLEEERLFDWTLTWQNKDPETIRTAVRDQLGFKLMPTRTTVEYLIVERDND